MEVILTPDAGNGVTITRVNPKHVSGVVTAVREAGFLIKTKADTITVSASGGSNSLKIATESYPGAIKAQVAEEL